MFSNYLKVALRAIVRFKGYSLFNIAGLAVGMSCFLLIFLYAKNELTYDSYHDGADGIYRISTSKVAEDRDTRLAGCSHLFTPVLREDFPEVQAVFNLGSHRSSIVRYQDIAFQEEWIKMTDDGIFEVLKIPFIHGRPGQSLDRPYTTVLTESVARRYFGSENPLGQALKIDTIFYEVTGVVADPPANTHIKYHILCSRSTPLYADSPWMHDWFAGVSHTYVKLRPGSDARAFESRISGAIHQYSGRSAEETTEKVTLFLQPITDIHLGSNLSWELEPPGSKTLVYGMAMIGLMALIVAALNFINLSTARSLRRSGEVGVRKVIGAVRGQIFRQFLGESILIATIALIVALAATELSLPWFSDIFGVGLDDRSALQPTTLVAGLLSVCLIGLLAGSYPALMMASVRPVSVLKSGYRSGTRRALMRKVLVVFQFAICSVLLVGIVTLYRQLDYMKNERLGFDSEQKLIVQLPGYAVTRSSAESVKKEFTSHPNILGATFSTSVPGRWNYRWITFPTGKEENIQRVNWYGVDFDFFSEYDFNLAAGRAFDPEFGTDAASAVVLNQAAVKAFGWKTDAEGLGKEIWREANSVVGVVENFHLKGLRSEIEPMGMFIIQDDFRYLSLRVGTENLSATVSSVRETIQRLFPEVIPVHFFLDEEFNRQYLVEEKITGVIGVATILSVFIACLGLFALVSYSAEQRTKEIGIRKVLGASVGEIVRLLMQESVLLVVIAGIIGFPLAYLAVDRLLSEYAYRIDVGTGTFVLALGVSATVACLAIVWQSLKAARSNPVETLKYE